MIEVVKVITLASAYLSCATVSAFLCKRLLSPDEDIDPVWIGTFFFFWPICLPLAILFRVFHLVGNLFVMIGKEK